MFMFRQLKKKREPPLYRERVRHERRFKLCDKTQYEGGFKMMVMMVKDRIYIIKGKE